MTSPSFTFASVKPSAVSAADNMTQEENVLICIWERCIRMAWTGRRMRRAIPPLHQMPGNVDAADTSAHDEVGS